MKKKEKIRALRDDLKRQTTRFRQSELMFFGEVNKNAELRNDIRELEELVVEQDIELTFNRSVRIAQAALIRQCNRRAEELMERIDVLCEANNELRRGFALGGENDAWMCM